MLSLEEKVGQLMIVGFKGWRPPRHILRWLAEGRVGGICLFARNIESPAQVKRLVADCCRAAKRPILVGIDQEGGLVARLRNGFSESPGAMALGAAGSGRLAEDVAFMLGRELAALGINWNFAPVADIAHQPDNPSLSTRSVGRDSALVQEIVNAQIRGFQRAGVAASVKHFPGLGNTIIDTHEALAKVEGSLEYLYREDLPPFQAAIENGVACVMLTHVMYSALDSRYPATLSREIVTGLLREELGYDGAVCTDCMEMRAIARGFGAGETAVLAVAAGVDLLLFSHTRRRQAAAFRSVLAAVKSGRIATARVDQAVERIQALKRDFALDRPPPLSVVGCDDHRALAAKAARAGTVLLKHGKCFPIAKASGRIECIEIAAQYILDASDADSRRAFSRLLSRRLPEAKSSIVDLDGADSLSDKALEGIVGAADVVILVTRNVHMQSSYLRLAQQIIDRSKNVILICARNPYDAGLLQGADSVVCTNGDSAPSLQAAVDAICGDFLPTGKLTVPLA